MENHIPVVRCQYCGSEDLGIGGQHGEGLMIFKYHGLLGNRLKYIICHCRAVLYQCVAIHSDRNRKPLTRVVLCSSSFLFI